MAKAVHDAGLSIPEAGKIVQVNRRNGLIYERVDGLSMWDIYTQLPLRFIRYARQTAELHAGMHAANILPDIPSQRRRLAQKTGGADSLPAPLKTAILEALSIMPDCDRLCQGDFHPGNILLSPRAVVIDWIDAWRENPLADVARTSINTLGAAASSQIPNRAINTFIRLSHAVYLRRYF